MSYCACGSLLTNNAAVDEVERKRVKAREALEQAEADAGLLLECGCCYTDFCFDVMSESRSISQRAGTHFSSVSQFNAKKAISFAKNAASAVRMNRSVSATSYCPACPAAVVSSQNLSTGDFCPRRALLCYTRFEWRRRSILPVLRVSSSVRASHSLIRSNCFQETDDMLQILSVRLRD